MYRCEVCRALSSPGESRRVHVLYREVKRDRVVESDSHTRREIKREIAVCASCEIALSDRVLFSDLLPASPRPRERVKKSSPFPSSSVPPPSSSEAARFANPIPEQERKGALCP